ncbi:hypothetical protein, partial [Providencia vermicola]|uniref:hypothetical protein n=2 Tax=Providencia vermicola TaxID=333965 RepID=UPI001CEC21E3
FFAFSFQNLSLPFQCSPRFALSCSRSVDAHYRESEKSGKCFFENNFQLIIFCTLRPVSDQKKRFFHQIDKKKAAYRMPPLSFTTESTN